MINSSGRVSLYIRVKQQIKSKIESGEWETGSKIPGEFSLSQLLGVSRETLRKALNELERDGLVVRKPGDGTYVAIPRIDQRLASFYSFSSEIRSMGLTPSTRVIDFTVISADPPLLFRLQRPKSPFVYKIRRLRLANGIPFAVETSYVPCDLFPKLTKAVVDEFGLYSAMTKSANITPDSAQETFEAIIMSEIDAELLNCTPPAAALYLERTTTSGDSVIEFCTSVVRGDMYKYHVLLQ
ncbi:MAG: GntR family transcriptional regulator [Oscillospiraceae bacterium]|nr:GntR family transcriptional regulator [Oscillospiraceae bacterium]